ncbi:YdaU family protein [Comamonas sp. MYb21]|uniref:YdaU family protein n=1 Tax=Comamonas sp. MYb21 TaxID=1848648 RepID=UPI00309CF4DB
MEVAINYYEHHIGDFLKKTVHLNAVEEGVYRRLLDRYYTTEKPLPADVRECCKLARAISKAERDAVRDVLQDFFVLHADGHHQGRADEEIARFKDKQAKAQRSANARWSAQRMQSEGNANASETDMRTHMRTHSERNAPRARPQTPIPNHQTPLNSVPDGTDGDHAPAAPQPDDTGSTTASTAKPAKSPEELAKAELWRAAVSVLEQGGCPQAQARSFMGKLVKDYSFPVVQQAVAAAVTEQPADAREYLKAACQHGAGQRQPVNRQEALESRNRNVADAWAAEGGEHANV